jgi:hypothetical protein
MYRDLVTQYIEAKKVGTKSVQELWDEISNLYEEGGETKVQEELSNRIKEYEPRFDELIKALEANL